jgi:hypothetical protein
MHRVRYFGTSVDPAQYRRGFGVRGLALQLVNAVRTALERWIVLTILGLELDRAGASKADKAAALAAAKLDSTLYPKQMHPVNRIYKRLFREASEVKGPETREELAEARYGSGRNNTQPMRPVPFEEGAASTFAGFMRSRDRSVRYFHGRSYRADPEGDVEPVEVSNNG